ncbi:MAG TPA: 2-C-methyl-D-erythritol 4-phosphate cytidylyltransferase [Pyrinomonadaceae bacterium]|jgi:2-C-methyl-D-erythritol 4-phosphate cytidylyltransferase|nr:2-C-methyl-D-erythritol 4-phosphate cytidylyltransferase [Pyrinomonadaceae bacterium]
MNIAIIAAAGAGTRMASDRPKQFLLLAGMPVIFHTLKRFEQCDSIHEVIVVLPAEESAGFLSLAGRYGLRKVARVVPGGATRADSVKRGLLAIRSATAEIVAVHDGVRPFVTVEEIDATIAAARDDGAAILAAPVTDTIKHIGDSRVLRTLDRTGLRRALTPQCFRYEVLRQAYRHADVSDPSLTDESALVEQLGHTVTVVEGSARNIKITTAEDFVIAEAILATDYTDR